jgi:hypothetical protein
MKQAKTFDLVTYHYPDGFERAPMPGVDHVSFRRVDPRSWILISIYQSRVTSRDHSAEFAYDWNDINTASGIAAPASAPRKVGAQSHAREGGAFVPSVGYVDLVDIHAGGRVIPIIVECGSVDQFRSYEAIIETFLGGLIVNQTPTSVTAEGPAPLVSTNRTSVNRDDLVGKWNIGSSKNVTYALLEGGEYFGATSHFFADEYTLAADGTYTFRAIQTHPRFKDHDAGTWGLTDGKLWTTGEKRSPGKYQILKFVEESDGRTTMTVLPATAKIDQYTYGTDWVRDAGSTTPAPEKTTAPK